MAAPSYTTDLSTLNLAENSGTVEELTGTTVLYNYGGTPVNNDTDDIIQGSYHASAAAKQSSGQLASIAFDNGSGVTVPSGGAFLLWHKFDAGGILDTYSNGGVRVCVGSSVTAFKAWKIAGRDVVPFPYGGWKNYALDPTVSADYTEGSPTSTLQHVGMAIMLTAAGPGKGNPHKLDAVRYGRCEARMNGGDGSNGYATFTGFAAKNDANDATNGYNRWGLIQAVGGGVLWKGLMTLGYSSAVDFRDSNVIVFIDDTRKVGSGFNKIEIRQSGSRVDWTGISFICISPSTTASKGALEVIDDCDVNIASCLFQDMDTLIFKGTSDIQSSIFRRCGLVTQNGAIFNGCKFDAPSGAVGLLSDDLNDIDNTTFISDGSGHAIELTTAHAGTSKTLTNVFFSGYGSAGTTDAAIYNNSQGAVTITISGGDTPTIRNGTNASTTVVTSARTIKVVAQKADGTKIASARVLLKVTATASGGFPYNVTVTIANSGTTATVTHTGHGLATNDKVQITGASHWQNNGVFSITKINDDSYSYTLPSAPGSNPTGTIKCSYVFLEGLTDSNGEISMSKAIGANQSVGGWARKSSAAPYYKEGPLAGAVSTSGDTTLTAILSPDE